MRTVGQQQTSVLWWGAGLLAFLVLDLVTFTPALAPLGVTPWNPSIGLVVAIVLSLGAPFASLLVVAPFVSDLLVRALPFPVWLIALEAMMIGLGYWLAIWVLNQRPTFNRQFAHLSDFIALAVVMAVTAGVVALAYNALLALTGFQPVGAILESTIRYWVGDVIGFLVVTPFTLIIMQRRQWPRINRIGVFQAFAVLAAVAVIFALSAQPRLQLAFLLLVPIIWMAAHDGFKGAAAGLLMMQISIMAVLQWRGGASVDVALIQAIMVILALSGMAIGLLIDERAEDERRLRIQQDALERAARIGSMAELATAIAHELNQPLTAAGNYARATVATLKAGDPDLTRARYAADQMIVQVDRSAEVIRRLRALIRTGRVSVVPHSVDDIVRDGLDLIRPHLQRQGIALQVAIAPGLPDVPVDGIQIQQVLTNMLRNAIESLSEHKTVAPTIRLSADQSGDVIRFQVADNGPGFPPDFDVSGVRTFASQKADGLGVGLSLCRSIVEAHGGKLSIESDASGARVTFTVPIPIVPKGDA